MKEYAASFKFSKHNFWQKLKRARLEIEVFQQTAEEQKKIIEELAEQLLPDVSNLEAALLVLNPHGTEAQTIENVLLKHQSMIAQRRAELRTTSKALEKAIKKSKRK